MPAGCQSPSGKRAGWKIADLSIFPSEQPPAMERQTANIRRAMGFGIGWLGCRKGAGGSRAESYSDSMLLYNVRTPIGAERQKVCKLHFAIFVLSLEAVAGIGVPVDGPVKYNLRSLCSLSLGNILFPKPHFRPKLLEQSRKDAVIASSGCDAAEYPASAVSLAVPIRVSFPSEKANRTLVSSNPRYFGDDGCNK